MSAFAYRAPLSLAPLANIMRIRRGLVLRFLEMHLKGSMVITGRISKSTRCTFSVLQQSAAFCPPISLLASHSFSSFLINEKLGMLLMLCMYLTPQLLVARAEFVPQWHRSLFSPFLLSVHTLLAMNIIMLNQQGRTLVSQ